MKGPVKLNMQHHAQKNDLGSTTTCTHNDLGSTNNMHLQGILFMKGPVELNR